MEGHRRLCRPQRIGIVFQQFNLFPHLKVMDNLTLAPADQAISRRDAEARAYELLDIVGLREGPASIPTSSREAAAAVAIARALMMEPHVMLFDEVASALDPDASARYSSPCGISPRGA